MFDASRRAVLAGMACAAPSLALAAREQGVHAFTGLRYAHAARFAPPQIAPLGAPLGVFAPNAPQRGLPDHPQSEDCHFLNIWTPDPHPKARRAVMVYFHGGAYTSGSVADPLTQGAHLAASGDVVVVSVNHRLNALGYLWLAPYGAAFADSGNLGQLDLICALRWIRAHIGAFGGDPARIMVFGQSGGGAKIATLMAMPAAQGLFHAAATMSGQQVYAQGPGHAMQRSRAYFAALGIAEGDTAALAAAPIARLVEALATPDPILGGPLYFGPVLDMRHLSRHPFWPDAAPQSLGVPMLLGNTISETRAFIDPRGPKLRGLDWSNLGARIAAEVKVDLDPAYVVERYRAHHPEWSADEVFFAATTAGRSWIGQIIEAEARAAAGAERTWVYCLDRASPLDRLRRAAHTDDIAYVFGTMDAPRSQWGGPYSGTDAGAQATSAALQGAFARLAKTGAVDWPPYRLPSRATWMVSETPHVEADPRGWERELWSLSPYQQPGM